MVWRLGAAPFGFKGAVFSYAQPLRWADTISASGAFKTSICSSEGRRASRPLPPPLSFRTRRCVECAYSTLMAGEESAFSHDGELTSLVARGINKVQVSKKGQVSKGGRVPKAGGHLRPSE